MILKPEFELVEVADEHMVIPVGDQAASFQGVIALSESAFFLLNKLKVQKTRKELVELLTNEYEIDPDAAEKDLDDFIGQLTTLGIITE